MKLVTSFDQIAIKMGKIKKIQKLQKIQPKPKILRVIKIKTRLIEQKL